ncbi:MAG: hypothetical protein QOI92_2189, partial [Chloroflexota bacterium]|nr:hypothetical protein [Chloroflexota bacterium]
VHRGRLVVGTLPSGRVHAMRVGLAASTGRAVSPGRHEVIGVRRGSTLELYLDGALAASETAPSGGALNLGNLPAATMGGGPRSRFGGRVHELHVAASAPTAAEVKARWMAAPAS